MVRFRLVMNQWSSGVPLARRDEAAEDHGVSETQDWRGRRWADTHQRIYDTAIGLFQQDGFEQVTVGQIAAGAGVSVPTFYAHYQSKEHLVMQLPTADDVAALLATQPAELAVGERIRRAAPLFFAQWDMDSQLVRWRIIATTPSLRRRAAEFERATAELVTDAIPSTPGTASSQSATVLVNAYLAAFTSGVLAWADNNGERKIEELVDEAFDALENR
jgi:AcrR family transcriptional regulator